MAALPPNASHNASEPSRPVLTALLNGVFVPVLSANVDITAFGVADDCLVKTFCKDTPLGDLGAWSQTDKYFPLIIKVGSTAEPTIMYQLLASYLDEMDTTYDVDADSIDIHGRGILAPFEDKRLSMKVDQSVTITAAIQQVLQAVPGQQYQVASTSVTVGKAFAKNNVSLNRNCRAMDFVNMLAGTLGWRVRVKGTTIIVGPPGGTGGQAAVPTLNKQWGHDVKRLRVKHNALHAHNIRVRVVSYNQASKAATLSSDLSGYNLQGIDPDALASIAATQATMGAKNTHGLATGGLPRLSAQEEYTYSIPGLTQAQCDERATKLQDEIGRHEFIIEIEWAPTLAELSFICANGPEFLLQLSGCSQASHNQGYHPKRITLEYSFSGGLICKILAVNHVIEQDSGAAATNAAAPVDATIASPNSLGSPTNASPVKMAQVQNLWTQNGGNPAMAALMAHVANSESSLDPSVVNSIGCVGLWQINVSAHSADVPKGVDPTTYFQDPNNNAKEAIKLYNESGMAPWADSQFKGGDGGWGKYA